MSLSGVASYLDSALSRAVDSVNFSDILGGDAPSHNQTGFMEVVGYFVSVLVIAVIIYMILVWACQPRISSVVVVSAPQAPSYVPPMDNPNMADPSAGVPGGTAEDPHPVAQAAQTAQKKTDGFIVELSMSKLAGREQV